MSDKKNITPEQENQVSETVSASQTSEQRRKAVRNILAGSGLAAGAATSGQWSKPLIDAVVLPAHAQSSTTTILQGNVNITPVVDAGNSNGDSLLDLFVGPAHAGAAFPDLPGACMTMTIVDATSFILDIVFFSSPMVVINGTISGTTMTGSNSGINVTGTIAGLGGANPTASGTVDDGGSLFGFNLSDAVTNCTPIGTTQAPATTCEPGYVFNGTSCEFETTTSTSPTVTTTTTTTATPTTQIMCPDGYVAQGTTCVFSPVPE